MAAEKRKRGRPQGSGMERRVTIRIPEAEYWFLVGASTGREKDTTARAVRKAIRFFMAHGAGKRQPENTEKPVTVVKLPTYDASKYVLGTLCKAGHAYGETGQSLRDKAGDCAECKRARNARRVRRKEATV